MGPAFAIGIEVQVVSMHQGTKLPGDLETSKPGQTGPAGILVLQVYRLCRPLSRHGTAINMVSGSQVKP